jgi:RNA polymerase sigma-70 factor (ECF subfamily)
LPRLLRARFDSLDFLQSVWGDFFQRMRSGTEQFEDPEYLIAFLARAARNKVIDQYRRAASLKHDIRREEPLSAGTQPARDVPAHLDTASDVAEAREALGRLRALMPEERRSILDLKAQGFNTQEIGERLGISERTVRRAMEALRRRAESEGGT